jgi:hypothetical protein
VERFIGYIDTDPCVRPQRRWDIVDVDCQLQSFCTVDVPSLLGGLPNSEEREGRFGVNLECARLRGAGQDLRRIVVPGSRGWGGKYRCEQKPVQPNPSHQRCAPFRFSFGDDAELISVQRAPPKPVAAGTMRVAKVLSITLLAPSVCHSSTDAWDRGYIRSNLRAR